MTCNFAVRFFLSLALFVSSSYAIAEPIFTHEDVMGDTVWYTSIFEGSTTDDVLPLYGQPSSSLNELIFPTTGSFAATSEAGSTADQTDGKLSFMVEAKYGSYLLGISFEETGITTLAAPFGGDAYTGIEAFALIDILEVEGEPVPSTQVETFFEFSPNDEFKHSDDAGGENSFSSSWTGSAGVRFERQVTKISVTVDNILKASTTSDDGTTALIDKKDFRVNIPSDTIPVPEPATVFLGFACGLFVFAGSTAKKLRT